MKHHAHTSQEVTAAPAFITIQEAVKRYGLSRSTFYNLMKDGLIKSHSIRRRGNIRGRRLLSVESIEQFINSQPEQ